jgi:hypothetical protein
VAALVEKARQKRVDIVFPVDYIIADKFDKDAAVRTKLIPNMIEMNMTDTRPKGLRRKRAFPMVGWVLTPDPRATNCSAVRSSKPRPFSGTGQLFPPNFDTKSFTTTQTSWCIRVSCLFTRVHLPPPRYN